MSKTNSSVCGPKQGLEGSQRNLEGCLDFLREGAVRYEALCVSKGGERPSYSGRRGGLNNAEGSLTRGTPGTVASGPDKGRTYWYYQTVRVCRAEIRRYNESELVVEAP